MRLLTNPGSNVPDAALARYDILLARQQIVVDSVPHDTRKDIPLSVVDQWVAKAREFPKVVGSNAQDMVPMFLEALETDPELLVVTTSKRLISTHTSAQAAAATVKTRLSQKNAEIAIVDTLSTDLGAGLVTIAAGEGIRAGLPLKDLVNVLEILSERGQLAMHVQNLLHPIKSGRAGFLKAWMASVLQVRPVMGFADGDLRILGRVREKDDPVGVLADHLLERIPRGTKVWLGIAHGNEPDRAARCLEHFQGIYDVRFALLRPLSSSIYLYSGPGALCVFAIPIDDLPWEPTTPTPAFG